MKLVNSSAALMIALAGITGCNQAEQETAKQEAKEALTAAAEKSEEVMQQAGEKLQEAVQAVREKSRDASDNVNGLESSETLSLSEDKAQSAVAVLHATADNEVKGSVFFTEKGEGLSLRTTATGLSPGPHGYHIHIYGDCSAPDATSAGTHFNLQGSSLNPPKDIDHITGNLGTLFADQNGNAEHRGELIDASLTGPKSIIGRAVIVHAKANDPKQPPIGAAGSRVACGVIGIADPGAAP